MEICYIFHFLSKWGFSLFYWCCLREYPFSYKVWTSFYIVAGFRFFTFCKDWLSRPRKAEGRQIAWSNMARIKNFWFIISGLGILKFLAFPNVYGCQDPFWYKSSFRSLPMHFQFIIVLLMVSILKWMMTPCQYRFHVIYLLSSLVIFFYSILSLALTMRRKNRRMTPFFLTTMSINV